MSFLGRKSIDEDARREALAGVNSVDDHITLRLGPRPKDFDPVRNYEHGEVAAKLGRRAEMAELTDDLGRAEKDASRHANVWGLNAKIAFCFLVEVLGGVLVMKTLGRDEGERLPLGVALGLSLIGITAATSNRTATAPGGGEPSTPQRRNATALILSVYSFLVIALAVVRLRMGTEDSGGLDSLPETVVMIATTIGPAWVAEHYLAKRRPAIIVTAEVSRLKRRIRSAGRESNKAAAFLTRLAREQVAWDEKAARLRAAFESERRLTRAEQGQGAPINNPNEGR